jgi:hypothetical protein
MEEEFSSNFRILSLTIDSKTNKLAFLHKTHFC